MNLIQSVNNEHVNQILTCSIKPVVEGSGSLGELKMKRVHTLKNLLSLIHTMSPLLGECTKSVPLVTDLLTSSVDSGTIPVVKGIKLLGTLKNLLSLIHTMSPL